MSPGGHATETTPSCRACEDNRAADRGEDEWAVAELASGYARLNPTQYHRGAAFFVSRSCVDELHDLAADEQAAHLTEMVAVAQAVFTTFSPRKLNYEALGNSVPHLHWWITPRYHDDLRPRGPIWEDLDFLRALWTGGARPEAAERDRLRRALADALEGRGQHMVRRFC